MMLQGLGQPARGSPLILAGAGGRASALVARWRNSGGVLPFVAPVHILLLLVIVLPSLYVFWLSLNASTYGEAPRFVGLANYGKVLSDPAFRSALGNTGLIVVGAVNLELLLALGMALLFAGRLPAKRFLLMAVLAPYAISEVTAVAMWRFLFDPDSRTVPTSGNSRDPRKRLAVMNARIPGRGSA